MLTGLVLHKQIRRQSRRRNLVLYLQCPGTLTRLRMSIVRHLPYRMLLLLLRVLAC